MRPDLLSAVAELIRRLSELELTVKRLEAKIEAKGV